jgi:hypothetical protein
MSIAGESKLAYFHFALANTVTFLPPFIIQSVHYNTISTICFIQIQLDVQYYLLLKSFGCYLHLSSGAQL